MRQEQWTCDICGQLIHIGNGYRRHTLSYTDVLNRAKEASILDYEKSSPIDICYSCKCAITEAIEKRVEEEKRNGS